MKRARVCGTLMDLVFRQFLQNDQIVNEFLVPRRFRSLGYIPKHIVIIFNSKRFQSEKKKLKLYVIDKIKIFSSDPFHFDSFCLFVHQISRLYITFYQLFFQCSMEWVNRCGRYMKCHCSVSEFYLDVHASKNWTKA